jgi:hypothetical protein
MDIKQLLEEAKRSGIPEVLEAVATIVLQYAAERPLDEERDWHILAQDMRTLARKAGAYEEHFSSRRHES